MGALWVQVDQNLLTGGKVLPENPRRVWTDGAYVSRVTHG